MIFNQYSFGIAAASILIVAGLVLFRKKPRLSDMLAYLLLTAGLAAAWLALRPTQTQLMGEAAAVQKMIGAGVPVLLEFQSPYCVGCMAIKPTVDALEQELDGRLHIIRLDVQSPVGRELAPVYGFQFTPTFIFFDAQGREAWRQIGGLDADRVRRAVEP